MNKVRRRLIDIGVSVALLLASVLLCLGPLELVIRAGLMPDGSVPWFRADAVAADRAINLASMQFAATHPFLFRTPITAPEFGPNIHHRIAVLGDSFVWGDGSAAMEDVWPHQLARLVHESNPDTEIMAWGLNGWSTKDELAFLKVAGNFGMMGAEGILLTFVTNDPDVGAIPFKTLSFTSEPWRVLAAVFPNAHAFITANVTAFHDRFIDQSYGFLNWQNALYSPENLAAYEQVLVDLKSFCDSHGLWLAVVLTPHVPDERYFHDKYATITALFDKVGIPYVNPLAQVIAAGDPKEAPLYRSLWANPANGHPGPKLTRIYASEAFRYLKESGHLNNATSIPSPFSSTSCDNAGVAKVEPPTKYSYLGADYLRLRGSLTAVADSHMRGRLTAGSSEYPLLIMPAGKMEFPGVKREFPPDSFWVDVPAFTDLTAAVATFEGGGGCIRARLEFEGAR